MEIILAGYNVDTEILNSLKGDRFPSLTPETFSAAYARISRSPLDITTLRQKAREDVGKARRSNRAIIFEMGHHSVAEHAVFNFDIMGISRLALEEIEKLRLVSFTEKSQRYVTLKGDYTIPPELEKSRVLQSFHDTVVLQNRFYHLAYKKLKELIYERNPDLVEDKKNRRLLEGWAKEDARYILSLATQGQVGVTINARNLEHLFRRLALSPHAEIRTIGEKIFDLAKNITPSIILFPQPSKFESKLHLSIPPAALPGDKPAEDLEPRILSHTLHGDDVVLAALQSARFGLDYAEAKSRVNKMPYEKKEAFFKDLFRGMEFFDSPPREFEYPDITFQADVSAANYAQLKRHRMATIITGPYLVELANTIPDSIREVGLDGEFTDIIQRTNQVYAQLKEENTSAADYILTNSHRRRVQVKMNLREIYHFARLRCDATAQWDIRRLADWLVEKTRELMPLAGLMLCGKSDFIQLYEKNFHHKPEFTEF